MEYSAEHNTAPGTLRPGAAAHSGVLPLASELATTGHAVAKLRSGLLLLEVEYEAAADIGGAVEVHIDGRAARPPTCALALGDVAAPRLLFVARFAGDVSGATCELSSGGRLVAAFRLGGVTSASAFQMRQCVPADGARVLRFLAGTCSSLLRLGSDVEFAALCLALARTAIAPHAAKARPLSRPDGPLSLWEVQCAYASGSWHLIGRSGIRRVAAPVAGVLALDGPVAPGSVLLPPFPAGPLALPMASETGAGGLLPALPALIRRGLAEKTNAEGRRAVAALAGRAGVDRQGAAAARLLREAQLLAPARPQALEHPLRPVGGALELALDDGAGGLFLAGWTRDPLKLIAGFELRDPFGSPPRPIPPGTLHRVSRPDLDRRFATAPHGDAGPAPGFVAHLPQGGSPAVAQWRLGLRLASGETIELVGPPAALRLAAARDRVLRSVSPSAVWPGLLDGCILPAATRLHHAVLSAGGSAAPQVVRIGATPRRPRCSIVVPLYRNLRFLRFQIAAFANDAGLRDWAELVYVLDSPEQRAQVEHLLRGLSGIHGLGFTLVVLPENLGYASACNAGAHASSAPVLLMLNSDVVPTAPGWLEVLLRRLSRDKRLAAVGPKLIFDDGSIQHAGLVFRRGDDGDWLNDHYFKGFPRRYPPAEVTRRVPGITGAAFCVRRATFEAVGGFCTDYIIGDYEDSDLCLKLRAAGGDIAYEPAAELYHFERQSIEAHAGYMRTLAGSCNRRLHHLRWDAAMTTLMSRFPKA